MSTTEQLLHAVCESASAVSLATRLHLYLLLFQDNYSTCARALQDADVFGPLISLLEWVTNIMKRAKDCGMEATTPTWLAPLLLVMDQYEKAALYYSRRKDQSASHSWKWFDDRSGRWCNYSNSNNTSIDTAYHAGETSVKFTAGRRRYVVLFKTLVQINEDTGNRRPIMLDVMQGQRSEKSSESTKEQELKRASTSERSSGLTKAAKRKHTERERMEVDPVKVEGTCFQWSCYASSSI